VNDCLRSTWASEKPVKGFAVLIAAQALCAVPQLGLAQQAESHVLKSCHVLDRAEHGLGWSALLRRVCDKRFGQIMFPKIYI